MLLLANVPFTAETVLQAEDDVRTNHFRVNWPQETENPAIRK